jgi:hypothetical protein
MSQIDLHNLDSEEVKQACDARLEILDRISKSLANISWEVGLIGHLFGDDRRANQSPFGHGCDSEVSISIILEIGASLIKGASLLISTKNLYGAAALSRQLVEVEYLIWAFSVDDSDAEKWIRSNKQERLKTFQPKHLREKSKGGFSNTDYGLHCEYGGHPTPDGQRLLRASTFDILIQHSKNIAGFMLEWIVRHQKIDLNGAKLLLTDFHLCRIFLEQDIITDELRKKSGPTP